MSAAPTPAPMPTRTSVERLQYLDSMRGVLMMLGVIIHAANVFSVSNHWVVWDSENASVWMTRLAASIHVFRMPAFFVVSGLLFARSLRSRGVQSVLRARLVRIGVPLVVVMLTVNTIERLWVYQMSGSGLQLAEFLLNEFALGRWLGHLWFLLFLLGFMITTLVCNGALAKIAGALPSRTGMVLPVLAPVIILGIHVAAKVISPMNLAFMGITPVAWLDSFTFFAFGWVLGLRQDILQSFCAAETIAVAAPVAALAWAASSYRVAELYLSTAITWVGVCICFLVFARLFNTQPSRPTRLLVESSYSVYVFHHLAVVLLGFAAVRLHWSLAFEFTLVCGGALAISLLIHDRIIKRSRVAAFLFNGVPLPAASPIASDLSSSNGLLVGATRSAVGREVQ